MIEAAAGAAEGRIVTLGVRPTEPSHAYGYIKPHGRGLSAVDAFVEKPTAPQAQAYIDAGYLWNSGNFIVAAATLIDELAGTPRPCWTPPRSALPDEGRARPDTGRRLRQLAARSRSTMR